MAAVALALMLGSSTPVSAYTTSAAGFANGQDLALVAFLPGVTDLLGASLRIPTNATVQSGRMEIAGRPGLWNSSAEETTTADFTSDTRSDGVVASGYPFASGNASGTHPEDFFLDLEADSSGWTAYVIDRRPLVTAEEATTTGVDSIVNGKVATLIVSEDVLGDPSTFTFWIGTLVLKSAHLGGPGWTILDFCGSPPALGRPHRLC